MSKPVSRRPMTADESLAYHAMCGHVRFPAASWDKRFFNQLRENAISDKEAPQLWRLFIRYRRQIGYPRLLKIAESLSAPDFRKQQKALSEQARIDEMKKKYGGGYVKAFNP